MAKSAKDPGPSSADVAQIQVAGSQWNDYVARFRPAEAELVKRSEFSAGERNRVRGEVSADAAAAFSGLARKTVSAGAQAGQNVASGATKLAMAGNAAAKGVATGVGKAAATLGGRLESEKEKFRVAQIGRGIVSDVQTDLSRAARRQTQMSIQKATLKAELQNQKIMAAATVAGAATRKFGPDLLEKDPTKFSKDEQQRLAAAGMTVDDFDFGDSELGYNLINDTNYRTLYNRITGGT